MKAVSRGVSELDAIVGLLVLALLLGLVSLLGVVIHIVVRPRGTPRVRAPDALKRFEPRGGRQRFSVRLFEAGMLAATSIIGLSLVGLWAATDTARTERALLGTAVVGGCLVVATWWAWRRGALRGPARRSEPRVHLLARRKRGVG